MFLIVMILSMCRLILSSEPFHSSSSAVVIERIVVRPTSASEDDLCEEALSTFMKRGDSDIAKYIKPHLVSAIKEASSSPESDSEEGSPSPKRIMRTWVKKPESVKSTPKPELDEVILSAVQKAFQEKEEELEKKSVKIGEMFSKKTTTIISTIVGVIATIATSLGSVYGTINNYGNCTK